jgi:hypothetical protein
VPSLAETAVQRLVAIATSAAHRLGPSTGSPRRAILDALVAAGSDGLVVAGSDAPMDVPGAALVAEVIRRDRAYAPATDSWSFQLDARALSVAPLLSRGAAAEAIEMIAPPEGAVFLDAGGGLGDATRAFLAAAPTGRAILVDTSPILVAAKRHLGAVADRVTFVAADLRHDALPSCDIALLANVLHLHSAADRTAIVENASRAARVLALKDIALADTRDAPLAALAFALVTAVFSDGAVLTESEIASLARAVGREPQLRRMAVASECALVLC